MGVSQLAADGQQVLPGDGQRRHVDAVRMRDDRAGDGSLERLGELGGVHAFDFSSS